MIAPPIERVTGCPKPTPSNRERTADWYAKAARTDYPLMFGPRWDVKRREYERQAMQDAEPVEPNYDN